MDTREAATAFWETAEARRWDEFASMIADEVLYECAQTRERIRGRDAYVRFNREFPGDWHMTVDRVVAGDRDAVTLCTFTLPGEVMTGIAVLTFDEDGRVVRVDDFWPEPYEPPADRAHLAERY
jgi:hypothetical protein